MEQPAPLLNKNWFMSLLNPNELALLNQKTTLVNYNKRETITKSGEFATHLLVLIDGFVKVEINEGKKNFIVDIVPAINIIGFPALLSSDKHIFSITALTNSVIRFIPIEIVREIIEGNGKVALAAIMYGNESFILPMLNKLHCLSQNNIRGRLAKLLLHLSVCTHRSNNFTLLITRSEMSQMIGFSRENIIRMLSEFHTDGIIHVKGKRIELLNTNKLEELARYS